MVYVFESPDQQVVLQVVGRRVDVPILDEWRPRAPQTQIVAIGSEGSINSEGLTTLFEACTLESVTSNRLDKEIAD